MPLKASIIPVTPFQQNCVLVWDDQSMQGTVIDPGGDVARIEAEIAARGVTLTQILLTHGHIDHAGGADELREKTGIAVTGPHRADAILLDHLEQQGRAYDIRGARNLVPDRWLEEGESITIGGETFDVLHCPGHSPGSLVYVSKDLRVAFVGDVLFQGSIGRTDFPYGDHDALITAITTKLLPLGDDIAFVCGHGPGSDFGTERRSNPFLQG
ncbi:MBL fold metallo-hydrolase [Sediminicoccus rosea]|jgi:hydroxyacylglutathione hydrolase|uniref:MBL fold metallo-hydrolase n=1 Tax=Sediminicoccus rosea TaxID=1225128 RepID=A0ABZ0PHY5_9PROT|nr:MBL fold metallo-hydrolase [Sediminicoccus rosea]WPB85072.1 MBL fold metallo-hydrolase [Sediminicoccus rosea]